MKSTISAAVVVSLLALVGVAYAGSHAGPMSERFGEQRFAAIDSNHDGTLSRAEFQARQEQLWQEADSNKDGAVTLDEAHQARDRHTEKRAGERFSKLDANHDGRLTQQEAARMPAERYAHLDVNADGALTLDEFKAGRAAGRHGCGGQHGPRHGERGAAARPAK